MNSKGTTTVVDDLPGTNRMIIMSDKGANAKGTAAVNITQMIA
jgi:hypothetical protein